MLVVTPYFVTPFPAPLFFLSMSSLVAELGFALFQDAFLSFSSASFFFLLRAPVLRSFATIAPFHRPPYRLRWEIHFTSFLALFSLDWRTNPLPQADPVSFDPNWVISLFFSALPRGGLGLIDTTVPLTSLSNHNRGPARGSLFLKF